MATMPTFQNGKVIYDDEWNSHATQINANTVDLGTLFDKPYARYQRADSLQEVASGNDAKVQFDVAVHTHSDVVPSGSGNRDFTLNRAGLWAIDASVRFEGNAGGGERAINTCMSSDLFYRYSGQSGYPAGNVMSLETSVTRRFTAGETLSIIVFQNSGAILNLLNSFQESLAVSFLWVGP